MMKSLFNRKNRIPQQILERDGYTCQKCGRKKKLLVYNTVNNSKKKLNKANPDHLITLCERCYIEEEKSFRELDQHILDQRINGLFSSEIRAKYDPNG